MCSVLRPRQHSIGYMGDGFLQGKFHPEILRGSPRAGALNEGGVGKIGDFRTLSRHISETAQDRTKVAIDY